MNKKLEEETESLERKCENLTRENEELKKKNEALRKDSGLLNEILASVSSVAAKRRAEDSLPDGSEDEQNNQQPPAKCTKYD